MVVSLNTAIDRVLLVPGLRQGTVMRVVEARAHAGGKALNVARALRLLGEPARVVGFLGGVSARSVVEEGCREMGLETAWVETAGESRTCVTIVDPDRGEQTVLNEEGPAISGREVERLRSALRESVAAGDLICLSGSVPPGVPQSIYGSIVEEMSERGARTLVDASGTLLRSSLEAHPWAIKPNEEESRSVLGADVGPMDAARMLARKASVVLLSRGRDGAILAEGERLWEVTPPPIEEVNAVASGDAFVAGFLAGTRRGMASSEAVRLAAACGASNAMRLEPSIGPWEEIERLMERVAVRSM